MQQRSAARTNLIVGIFVLGGLVVFAITIMFVGGKGEPFAQRVLVKSRFSNTGGLLDGAPVRLAGVDIGTVYGITFADTQTEFPVIVTLEISAKAADRIARDAKASIRQLGLLGDKYVEIVQGNVALGTIREARYIEGQAPFDLSTVYDQLEEIVTNIRSASGKVGEALEMYATPETVENVSRIVKATRTLLEEIRDGQGFLHAIVYEEAHRGMLKDLGATAANLKSASDFLEGVLGEVRSGKGSLHTLIYGDELARAAADLEKVTASTREVLDVLQKGDGLAHRLFYDDEKSKLGAEFGAITKDLRSASSDIKEVANALKEGKGTLGAIIQDPALYDDLRLLFGGAGRSSWMRYIIRSMVEENEQRAVQDQPK